MGEKTGFLTVLLIFAVGVIPILFTSFTSHVEGSKLLNVSTEVQQLVSAEGGVTPKVQETINKFGERGLTITVKDGSGSAISGRVPVGETVYMTYEFNGFTTENSTTILRRGD